MTAPARGYSWAPFTGGNRAALRHGARSPRTIQPLADKIARKLTDAAPWTATPTFAPTVSAWAWSEAQAMLLRAYIDEHGLLDDDGKPIPATDALERAEGRAARLRIELGLTPSSWSKLLERWGSADHDAAARGLEALKATGRELTRALALPEGATDA